MCNLVNATRKTTTKKRDWNNERMSMLKKKKYGYVIKCDFIRKRHKEEKLDNWYALFYFNISKFEGPIYSA